MVSPREDLVRSSEADQYSESPSKRRRITPPQDIFLNTKATGFADALPALEGSMIEIAKGGQEAYQDHHETISISASSRQAGQTIAPFLVKHIPEQYAPQGGLDSSGNAKIKDPNTKYCYRHRPDLKCRRQANEPSMDQLQHVSPSVSPGKLSYAHSR